MTEEIVLHDRGDPLLDQFSADGFVDCTFRIAEVSSDAKGYRLLLAASHRGLRVGFRAVVMRGLRGGFDADMDIVQDRVYRPAVEFVRSGSESDALITALAGLYGMTDKPLRMADITPLTGIVLHQDDVAMETEPIKIKLFGCDSDEEIERDEYFESFFNLNLRAGFVFWNEKDPDYRSPLIRGLSVGAG